MRSTVLVVFALADGTFVHGLLSALADAGMPHTEQQLGSVLGTGLFLAASQLYQAWRNRRQLHRMVAETVAGHLAKLTGETPSQDAV